MITSGEPATEGSPPPDLNHILREIVIFPYILKEMWSMILERIKQFFQGSAHTQSTSKEIRTGKLSYFNRSRGYGFIKPDGPENRIFVHVSDMVDNLKVGDDVKFYVENHEKGPKATQVVLA
jgi:CspA family cold shock protein